MLWDPACGNMDVALAYTYSLACGIESWRRGMRADRAGVPDRARGLGSGFVPCPSVLTVGGHPRVSIAELVNGALPCETSSTCCGSSRLKVFTPCHLDTQASVEAEYLICLVG